MQALRLLGQQLTKIWEQLGFNQKIVLVISGMAVGVGLGGLVLWTSRPNYALLYGRLDPTEAGKIISVLEEMKVPHKVGAGGSSIHIPQDKVHITRMQLAVKGIPKSDGVGFEIFEKPAFGMSDFMQQANYMRALQGELARTIEEINGIEKARVMISKPENRLLIDPQKKAKASVFIKLSGNSQIEPNAVNSIRLIVANSVEGLRANDVSISDNAGNVLSENTEDGSIAQLSSTQLASRKNYEKYLASKVKGMLEKVLGPDQVVVEVSAELNTETVTTTDEIYDKNKSAPRTETVKDEVTETATPTPGGVPGTTTNSSTDTNSPAFSNSSNHSKKIDSTKEYAVSMSRTNTTRVAGDLKRVTASVFYNTNSNPTVSTNALLAAVYNALGLKSGTEENPNMDVSLYGISFNVKREVELGLEMDKERRTEFLWKTGRTVLYAVLALAALLGFWRLVRNSTEELLPTGISVGSLVGGQLVYESPVGVGGVPSMAMMPTGSMASMGMMMGEGQRVEEVVSAGDDEVEELQAAKSKLVMDFGLGQQAPERITIEVLKQLIRENPIKMSQAARVWMTRKTLEEGGED